MERRLSSCARRIFDWCNATASTLTLVRPQQLAHVCYSNTFHLTGSYSRFRRRRWGAPVGDIPGDRFVIGRRITITSATELAANA